MNGKTAVLHTASDWRETRMTDTLSSRAAATVILHLPPMNEKFSIPGAVVLAGVIIAGAILFTRLPVRTGGQQAASPVVAGQVAERAQVPPVGLLRPIDPSRDHIRGEANAPVTIVEYSDTECPFCKTFHPTLQQVIREYDGKVRWVYRHLPLDALHPKARKEAEATECAGEQGKFWEYLDKIFEVTPSNNGLDPAQLPQIAGDVGLDVKAFETCLNSGKFAQHIQEDITDAEKAGGRGTPYSVILGPQDEKIPFSGAQPYGNLKEILDGLLPAS